MPDRIEKWCEADRLAVLRDYNILDTEPDDTFGDFVQIAAHICNAPIAVVNFIDKDRQWFAAEKGLGVRETSLDVSICAHAILQNDIFIVPDLTKDSRFDCNPLVTDDPRLRFYGGALLKSPEGLPLGTMCVLDYKPRPTGLNEQQIFTLRALSRQVTAQLELKRNISERDLLVKEAHHRIKNSLQMVQSMLRLQARSTKNEEAAHSLSASVGRVMAFSTMHEHLYNFGDKIEINLEEYLKIIMDDQENIIATMLEGRRVIFKGSRAMWPASDAPALGIIAMELVTNALKYGEGTVSVTCRASGRNVVLTVEDEGQALPTDFVPSSSTGLGMRVVTGLLTGRRGRLEVDRSRGHTCFVATLHAPALKA